MLRVETSLRLLIAAWIVVALVRAARSAWSHRALIREIWRGVTWRVVGGALGLLVVVSVLLVVLVSAAPVTGRGLGDLVGFSGNAVFVPLEEAARATPVPETGVNWPWLALTSGFLGLLVVLLPWLAWLEEEVFRAGLEEATLGRRVRAAAVFGAVHLVMLVPVAAAIVIGLAGFVYGEVYRHAHAQDLQPSATVGRAFRSSKRSRAAAATQRSRAAAELARQDFDAGSVAVALARTRAPELRQAAALVRSTVWHTTFNTIVVVTVWLTIVLAELLDPASGLG